MATHYFFLVGLYLLGFLFALALFGRKLPFAFICIVGFVWGVLVYALLVMLLLSLALPYTPAAISTLLLVVIVGLVWAIHRQKLWGFTHAQLLTFAAVFLFHAGVLGWTTWVDFSFGTNDTIGILISSNRLARGETLSDIVLILADRSPIPSVVYTVSHFLDGDYFSALIPGFAASFLLSFAYFGFQSLRQLGCRQPVAAGLVALTAAVLITSPLVRAFFSYIHTNFPAAVYLFLAAAALGFALRQRESAWLLAGVINLTAFSFTRVEAPLFAILFLVLVIQKRVFKPHTTLKIILPSLLILLAYNTQLLVLMGEGSRHLNPRTTIVMLVTLAAFALLLLGALNRRVELFLLPKLGGIMIAAMLLLLGLMWLSDPVWVQDYLRNMFRNMFTYGSWNGTWHLLIPLLLLSVFLAPQKDEQLFGLGILGFFILLQLIGFMRVPLTLQEGAFGLPALVHDLGGRRYERLGWTDSTNRMLIHILPLVYYYLLQKYAPGMQQMFPFFRSQSNET